VNVAFYGGSFDPPHMAHVMAVAVALASGDVDRILVVPCYQHAFGKGSVPFEHRLKMARLAFSIFGDAVSISPVEQELTGPSRTLNTLQHLISLNPDWSLRLLIGTDILAESADWYRFDEVITLAPPLIIGRTNYAGPAPTGFALPDLSSSTIRKRISSGQSVKGLVPQTVQDYINTHRLYHST
jgi:nicotinate-nucleotide adenylyltransferase